ncbi:Lrp/AsnC family transcriptional regulator [Taurinivorans muris]|uniref:siroheme decarboxylase n=1 Tax=Taurinivorans muris TaxID=2787751 RepID=A0ABY5Y502_9BACT|nr:Lrp/AsnC family transcriptional regulator [Mailhella sp.]UWX06293.1 Lrp/AsnC family transcriptional regulator [Desulfovibrionaceae bacterium LT0009]
MSYQLNDADKKILDIIQSNFPLSSRPYKVIGDEIGMEEEEVLANVLNLKKQGIIRRLGANFQSKKLGFRSTLCAAKVPDDKLDLFIQEVNAKKGVTHNYLRKHEYNVWFTLIGPSWENVCETLAGITAKTGIEILNLPATKLFKIRVDFAMQDD